MALKSNSFGENIIDFFFNVISCPPVQRIELTTNVKPIKHTNTNNADPAEREWLNGERTDTISDKSSFRIDLGWTRASLFLRKN